MEVAIFFLLNIIIAGTTTLNLLNYLSEKNNDEVLVDLKAEDLKGLRTIRIIALAAFVGIIILQYSIIQEYVLISVPVIAVSILANLMIEFKK